MNYLSLLTIALLIGVSIQAPAFFAPYGPSNGDATLYRNDDEFTGQISLIGGMNFFGSVRNYVYVDNNGLITLDQQTWQYTPVPFSQVGTPSIAVFWADVDTRNANGGYVYYRSTIDPTLCASVSQFIRDTNYDTTFHGTKAFVATWDSVGYYYNHADKLNTFQNILIADDVGNTFAVFNYGNIQWITGDASGGSGGFGGTAAAVGFAKGDGITYAQVTNSLTQAIVNVNHGTNAYINGVAQTGQYVFSVSNGVNTDSCCQTSNSPTLIGTPSDLYFEVASIHDVPAFTGTVTASAECTSPSTSVVPFTMFEVFGCPVKRTWSYTDACNKNTQVVQVFHYPEVFTEEFTITVPADYYIGGSCGSASAPDPSVSGTPSSNRGSDATFTHSDSAFTMVDGVCSMDRFWIGEDICEVTKLGRQRIIVGVAPSLTTAAITTGPLMPPLISVPQYCSQFPIDEGAQAYYCSADHTQYYACMTGAFNSQSVAFACPATLYCNCAPGVECSQGGLVSPCDYPPSP